MFIEFKEKTFESYFVSELSRKSNTFYCPDQADERHLGFDAMFNIPYWRYYFSLRSLDIGVWSKAITPDEVEAMGKHFNRVYPDIKANLFFQFKRPEFLTTKNAKEWEYWNEDYFRFSLYEHQHNILIELSHCVSKKARVLYAAPRLRKTKELINSAKRKEIIQKTQVVEARKLSGHKKCTYSSTSKTALGHSEPEKINPFFVADFLQETASLDGENFTQALKRISSEIKEAFADNQDAKHILNSARFLETDELADAMPQEFRDSWLDHLTTIKAFSRAFGITTCLLG